MRDRSGYNRKYGASPFFQKDNTAAIPALGSWIFNYEDVAAARKYLPFNLLMITNASNYLVRLYINHSSRYLAIPANATKTFDRSSVPVFFAGRVYNTDTLNAISAKLISIEAQKEMFGTSNVIESIHKVLRGV